MLYFDRVEVSIDYSIVEAARESTMGRRPEKAQAANASAREIFVINSLSSTKVPGAVIWEDHLVISLNFSFSCI